MSFYLILTEKPAQAKVIASIMDAKKDGMAYSGAYRGHKIVITPLRGHIMSTPHLADIEPFKSLMPDGKWFSKKSEIVSSSAFPHFPKARDYYPREVAKGEQDYSARFLKAKESAQKSNGIILAVDPDYEGSALAYEVLIKANATSKILTQLNMQSSSAPSVKKELDKAFDGKYNDYHKRLALLGLIRSDIDFAIGINGTTLLSDYIDGFFPFGTQKARLMWEMLKREEEINSHTVCKYYSLAIKTKDGYSFKLQFDDDEMRFDKKLFDEAKRRVTPFKSITVNKVEIKPTVVRNAKWYDGITLGQQASKFLKIPLDKVMSRTSGILQSMYQKQVTSYPGTDGRVMPLEEGDKMSSIAESYRGMFPDVDFDFSLRKKHLWGKDIKQNHTPLTVDNKKAFVDRVALTAHEERTFEAALKHLMSVFSPDGKADNLKAYAELGGHTFVFSETYDKEMGWQKIYAKEPRQRTFKAKEGDVLEISSVELEEHDTEPPSYYLDSASAKSLSSMMKRKGIGTDNTIPELIKDALNNNYIELVTKGKSRYYNVTEKGRVLWSVFPRDKLLAIFDTFKNEIIPGVEDGTISEPEAFDKRNKLLGDAWMCIKGQKSVLQERRSQISAANGSDGAKGTSYGKCPVCKSAEVGKFKSKKGGDGFYSCRNRECKFTMPYTRVLGKISLTVDTSLAKKLLQFPEKEIKITSKDSKKRGSNGFHFFVKVSSTPDEKYHSYFQIRFNDYNNSKKTS